MVRVQKAEVKVIMGRKYSTYRKGLKMLKIDTLEKRREKLCLSFAIKCLKNEKVKVLFPLNHTKHKMEKRKTTKFKTFKARTNRNKKSA